VFGEVGLNPVSAPSRPTLPGTSPNDPALLPVTPGQWVIIIIAGIAYLIYQAINQALNDPPVSLLFDPNVTNIDDCYSSCFDALVKVSKVCPMTKGQKDEALNQCYDRCDDKFGGGGGGKLFQFPGSGGGRVAA